MRKSSIAQPRSATCWLRSERLCSAKDRTRKAKKQLLLVLDTAACLMQLQLRMLFEFRQTASSVSTLWAMPKLHARASKF